MSSSIACPIIEVWEFASSNPRREPYQTLRYHDGSTSCNCPGWTRRVQPDGSRSCKHTRKVDMGTADRDALSHIDYRAQVQPVSEAVTSLRESFASIPTRRIKI